MALVQTSGKKPSNGFTGGASAVTHTMPGNFTAGNSAVFAVVHFGNTAGRRITGVTIGGTAATKDIDKSDAGNNVHVEIWRATSMTGGTANIVISTDTGTGQYLVGSCEERDDMTATPLDQTGTGGPTAGSTAPSVTSTGATSQADEVVYAIFGDYGGTAWTSSTPPGSYTETFEEQDGATLLGGSAAYRVISATGSQTATFTTGSAMSWISAMATYKLSGGGSPAPKRMTMMGAG